VPSQRRSVALAAILLVAASLAACVGFAKGFEVRTTGAAGGATLQGTVGTDGPSITLRTSDKNVEVSAQ
jgi:hypothetical protein